MSTLAIWNLISITMMMVISSYLAIWINKMKYSIWTCLFQVVIHWNFDCFKWLVRNPRFIYYIILQVGLIVIILAQLNKFMQGDLLLKAYMQFIASPFIWFAVLRLLLGYEKRLKQNRLAD